MWCELFRFFFFAMFCGGIENEIFFLVVFFVFVFVCFWLNCGVFCGGLIGFDAIWFCFDGDSVSQSALLVLIRAC